MDVLALSLERAAAMIENDLLAQFKDQRYAGWDSGLGHDMLAGKLSLSEIAEHAFSSKLDPQAVSGRQEMLENLVNRAIFG